MLYALFYPEEIVFEMQINTLLKKMLKAIFVTNYVINNEKMKRGGSN